MVFVSCNVLGVSCRSAFSLRHSTIALNILCPAARLVVPSISDRTATSRNSLISVVLLNELETQLIASLSWITCDESCVPSLRGERSTFLFSSLARSSSDAGLICDNGIRRPRISGPVTSSGNSLIMNGNKRNRFTAGNNVGHFLFPQSRD